MMKWTTNQSRFSVGRGPRTLVRSRAGRYSSVFVAALLPLAFVAWQGAVSGTEDDGTNTAETVANPKGKTMDQEANITTSTQAVTTSTDDGSGGSSSTSTQSVSVSSSSITSSSSSIEVNGKKLHTNKDGELHKTIYEKDGSTTSIDISSDSDGTGNQSSTSLNVQINSESTDTQ